MGCLQKGCGELWRKARRLQTQALERSRAWGAQLCEHLCSLSQHHQPPAAFLPTAAGSGKKQLMGVEVCPPPFAFCSKGPPHPRESSPSLSCLTRINPAGCRSRQLPSWPYWLPLYCLKNESQFYLVTAHPPPPRPPPSSASAV